MVKYTDHLYKPKFLNEIGPSGMEKLGKLWFKHHDRASDDMLNRRFGNRWDTMTTRADKIHSFLKNRARRQGKPFNAGSMRSKIGLSLGKKLGITKDIGTPNARPGSVYDHNAVYDTLHQKSGERSMRAMGRLSNWYDKKGLHQD